MAIAALMALLLGYARPASAHAQVNPLIARVQMDLARADATAQAMQTYFGTDNNLLHEAYPAYRDVTYSWLWPYSQAMAGALDLADISTAADGADPSARQWLSGLGLYWNADNAAYNASVLPPLGFNANTYYDDNAWAGLDALRMYTTTGDPAALAQAENVFTFETDGWVTSAPCGGLSGGVYWLLQARLYGDYSRTTTATAGSAELALDLYHATRNPAYLAWGERMYDWVRANLRDPSTGLYWDHITATANGSCATDTDIVSYNQGVMLSATLALYRAVASQALGRWAQMALRQAYLYRAERIAQAALSTFGGQYAAQSAAFNAIFFQSLVELYPFASDDPALQRSILHTLQAYADWAWANVRDPQTTVFWFTPAQGYAALLDQAAMLETYALLAHCELLALTSAPAPWNA